jgi:hypothetical protein
LLGTALHTVQDFYVHSNGVEIGRSGVNSRNSKADLEDDVQ